MARMEIHYRRYSEQGAKNALLKATFRAFASMISTQIILGFCAALLNFASPWLILEMTKFIKDGANDPELTWENVKPGVIYAGLLCGTQVLSYLISEHMLYYNVLTGRRSSNAVIAFIYQKYSRISAATNKDFSSGQIINFI
jgi:ABC-type multidrug transport system fused ATPase/permease subunit